MCICQKHKNIQRVKWLNYTHTIRLPEMSPQSAPFPQTASWNVSYSLLNIPQSASSTQMASWTDSWMSLKLPQKLLLILYVCQTAYQSSCSLSNGPELPHKLLTNCLMNASKTAFSKSLSPECFLNCLKHLKQTASLLSWALPLIRSLELPHKCFKNCFFYVSQTASQNATWTALKASQSLWCALGLPPEPLQKLLLLQ